MAGTRERRPGFQAALGFSYPAIATAVTQAGNDLHAALKNGRVFRDA